MSISLFLSLGLALSCLLHSHSLTAFDDSTSDGVGGFHSSARPDPANRAVDVDVDADTFSVELHRQANPLKQRLLDDADREDHEAGREDA
jgi:hypothetical protein